MKRYSAKQQNMEAESRSGCILNINTCWVNALYLNSVGIGHSGAAVVCDESQMPGNRVSLATIKAKMMVIHLHFFLLFSYCKLLPFEYV